MGSAGVLLDELKSTPAASVTANVSDDFPAPPLMPVVNTFPMMPPALTVQYEYDDLCVINKGALKGVLNEYGAEGWQAIFKYKDDLNRLHVVMMRVKG